MCNLPKDFSFNCGKHMMYGHVCWQWNGYVKCLTNMWMVIVFRFVIELTTVHFNFERKWCWFFGNLWVLQYNSGKTKLQIFQVSPTKTSEVKSSQDKERKGNESKQTVSISQVPNFSKLADVSIFDRKEMVELINMKRILHLGAALSCMVFFPQTDFQGGNCSHCSQSKL